MLRTISGKRRICHGKGETCNGTFCALVMGRVHAAEEDCDAKEKCADRPGTGTHD